MIISVNRPKKQGCIDILIFDIRDFKPKVIRRGKGRHHILIKEKIHQENISMLNIYAPNIRTPKFVKETLLNHILTLKTVLTSIDTSARKKVNRIAGDNTY